LHPSWQRNIGEWLLAKFPRLQFIVVTHSPFLAQVQPDGNLLLRRRKGRVIVEHGAAHVTDWRVDQVFTELFDMKSVRSPAFERNLAELVRLRRTTNQTKATKAEGTTQLRIEQLEAWLQQIPPALEDPQERKLAAELRRQIDERRDEVEGLE